MLGVQPFTQQSGIIFSQAVQVGKKDDLFFRKQRESVPVGQDLGQGNLRIVILFDGDVFLPLENFLQGGKQVGNRVAFLAIDQAAAEGSFRRGRLFQTCVKTGQH